MRNSDGPFIVLRHPYGRSDLLTLRHVAMNNDFPHPINEEKVIVVPEPDTNDLQVPNDAIVDIDSNFYPLVVHTFRPQRDLMQVAFEFGKYLHSLPSSPLLHHRPVNLSIRATRLLGKSYPDMVNWEDF